MRKDSVQQGVGGSDNDPPANDRHVPLVTPPPQELVKSLQSPTPPTKQRPSRTRMHNPEQRKARALKMLEKRILEGKTTAQIAQDFGVSPYTAQRAMSFAAKGDLLVNFEDTLLRDLVPLAQTAAKMALMEGNPKVALEVLKGVGLLRSTHVRTQTQMAEEDALSRYIAQKRVHSQQLENTYDGQNAENTALSAANTSTDAQSRHETARCHDASSATAPIVGPDAHSTVESTPDNHPVHVNCVLGGHNV